MSDYMDLHPKDGRPWASSPAPDQGANSAAHIQALVNDAWREAQKAMTKYPQPNYVISKVAEEAGEVVKAAIHCAENRGSAEEVRAEIVQCLAMLFRLYLEGDGVHGLKPVCDGLRAC
jgi:phosphoribosyl-ATP pyrophosphohydrolase